MRSCWHPDPSRRPSFAYLKENLAKMANLPGQEVRYSTMPNKKKDEEGVKYDDQHMGSSPISESTLSKGAYLNTGITTEGAYLNTGITTDDEKLKMKEEKGKEKRLECNMGEGAVKQKKRCYGAGVYRQLIFNVYTVSVVIVLSHYYLVNYLIMSILYNFSKLCFKKFLVNENFLCHILKLCIKCNILHLVLRLQIPL